MSWVLFSIIAAVVWAICNIIDKYLIDRWFTDPEPASLTFTIFAILSGIGALIVVGFPIIPFMDIFWSVLAGSFLLFMVIFYFKALQTGEASRVMALFWAAPVFVAFFGAVFLGEIFLPLTYLGIFLMVAGAVAISYHGGKFKFNKAFWWIMASGIVHGFQVIITKYLLNKYDFWTVVGYTRIGVLPLAIPVIIWLIPGYKKVVKKHGLKVVYTQVFNDSINLIAIIFNYAAMAIGTATLVNALSSLTPFFVLLFAAILSIWFPKIISEEIKGSTVILKIFAITMIIAGAILIT